MRSRFSLLPILFSEEGIYLTSLGQDSRKSVAVIGGGVAGISAACALAEAGFPVQLIERRPYLGGRASSYLASGRKRDHRQLPARALWLLHESAWGFTGAPGLQIGSIGPAR